MRILHISEHYGNLGGAERYLSEICADQLKRGWNPIVAASSPPPRDQGPVRVYQLEPSFGLRSSRRARRTLERLLDAEQPNIVHLHNIQYFLGPALLQVLRSRTPVIQTVHDTRVICPRWISKIIPSATSPCTFPMGSHCFRHHCYPFHRTPASAMENLCKFVLVGWQLMLLRRLDRVLVPSAYIHQQLLMNGFSAHRLERMPLFLHADFAAPDHDVTTRNIVFAGRIDEAKGFRQFLECLARLSTTVWTAQVAGSGPFLTEAKAIAARLGLMGRIEFLGHVPADSLAQVLGAARVVVMPSLMPESFGLTGLEALACGVPVVAFDSGGIAEWLEDGVTGFLVRWGDVSALAARVRQLLEDDALAERLGRQGRQHAARFDRERHMNRLCEIYAETTAARHYSAAK